MGLLLLANAAEVPSRVHPIWPSYMCNYGKKEMEELV